MGMNPENLAFLSKIVLASMSMLMKETQKARYLLLRSDGTHMGYILESKRGIRRKRALLV